MNASSFDVTVIGGGPGGYVAAIRSAQLGFKTLLIERDRLGGTCLNWGCIPTKSLLHSVDLLESCSALEQFGVIAEAPTFDLDALVARSRSVADQLNAGIKMLLKKQGVTTLFGEATMSSPCSVEVQTNAEIQLIETSHVILATGARSRKLPQLESAKAHVWDCQDAMMPTTLPSSLLIIGCGAIGVEFASVYSGLGVEVMIIDIADRILPELDEDLSSYVHSQLASKLVQVHVGASLSSIAESKSGVTAVLETGSGPIELHAGKVLTATGVVPNTEGLGLEEIGVSCLKSGYVDVDDRCKTSVDSVYAIGDLAGPPCLAHKASNQGRTAIAAIAGSASLDSLQTTPIPTCVYCSPPVASVGLTEAAARQQNLDVKVGNFPFAGNGMALVLGQDGFVKTIVDARTEEILGVHIAGEGAPELINTVSVAMALESTVEELESVVFAHPSLSEMLPESLAKAAGRAIHI